MIKFFKQFFLKLKEKLNLITVKKEDIFQFNSIENPGPENWEKRWRNKYPEEEIYTPSESLLSTGFKIGYIQVKKFNKLKKSEGIKNPKELLQNKELRDIVKKTTCISNLTILVYGKPVDFWGIKGRSIPPDEILRLEKEYFIKCEEYLERLKRWDSLSEEEKESYVERVLYPTSRRFIFPALKQEFLNLLASKFQSITKDPVRKSNLKLLRYFNDPIYVDSNWKWDREYIYNGEGVGKSSFDFYGEAIKLGILYVKLNRYNLANFTVGTFRAILKSQTERTRELQTKAFYTWLCLLLDKQVNIFEYIKGFHKRCRVEEKLLLLFKYTKRDTYFYPIINTIADTEFRNKRSWVQKRVDKLIGKYKWYNEKLLAKIISLDPNKFLHNYPQILIKNINKNNAIIFETLAILHECVDQALAVPEMERKIETWFLLTWLEQILSSTYHGTFDNSKWERVEDYVKEYIHSSIQDQRQRVESHIYKNKTKMSLSGCKLKISMPFLAGTFAPWIGKDFTLTSLKYSAQELEFPIYFSFNIFEEKSGKNIEDNVVLFTEKGDWIDTKARTLEFKKETDWDWGLVCVQDLGYQLQHVQSGGSFMALHSKILLFDSTKLKDYIYRVLAVIHIPTGTIFSGFRSNNSSTYLNRVGIKDNNMIIFNAIVSNLKPLINVTDFL